MNNKKNKRRSIKRITITKILLSNLLVLSIVFISTSMLLYNYIFDNVATSRQMNLQQSGYSISVIKNAVDGISNMMMESLDDIAKSSDDADTITSKLTSSDELDSRFSDYISLMDDVGFDMSVDVVTVDGKQYSSNPLYESSLKSFISSQWFINMVYGTDYTKTDNLWGIRTIDPAEQNIMVLSYSRTISASDGSVLGVLIVNVNHTALYETYSQLLDTYSNNTVQIITGEGTIISHKNQNLIGFHTYDKNYINTKLPYNSSKIENTGNELSLTTTYFEPSSGWIIIEKLPVISLLKPLNSIFITLALIVCGSVILSAVVGIGISRSTTKRLSTLTTYMTDFHTEESVKSVFPILESDSIEIYTLGNGFNKMISNIESLIEDIRTSEIEKQQIEFNFLQAQINPHFLHNTLLSIKALIMLKRENDATEMLQSFIGLIKSPINVQNPLITLEEEINSIKNYIHIMEFRYSTSFNLKVDIPQKMMSVKFPQMTLQPIIENCIFHGFSTYDSTSEKFIYVTGFSDDEKFSLSITDTGKGMTKQQLENIWTPSPEKKNSFNHVSMGNILKRLHWIYGDKTDIFIDSTLDVGTTVTIKVPLIPEDCI